MCIRDRSTPASATQQRPYFSVFTVLAYLTIALAALLPRVIKLDQFITFDEINFWIERSATFLAALRSGDALATAISTHPGAVSYTHLQNIFHGRD